MTFVWVIGFFILFARLQVTKVIWIKHQNIILFVMMWFCIWFKITYTVFYQFCFFRLPRYSEITLLKTKIQVTLPASFNMRNLLWLSLWCLHSLFSAKFSLNNWQNTSFYDYVPSTYICTNINLDIFYNLRSGIRKFVVESHLNTNILVDSVYIIQRYVVWNIA